MDKWDKRFLDLAKHVSEWSKDPSTKVGAVVARGNRQLGIGFNGFPPSVEDKEEWLNDRDTKYLLVIHGELNAVFDALQKGNVNGCTLYTYPIAPCAECAKLIAALGIKRVMVWRDKGKTNTDRYFDYHTTQWILTVAGIQFQIYEASDE